MADGRHRRSPSSSALTRRRRWLNYATRLISTRISVQSSVQSPSSPAGRTTSTFSESTTYRLKASRRCRVPDGRKTGRLQRSCKSFRKPSRRLRVWCRREAGCGPARTRAWVGGVVRPFPDPFPIGLAADRSCLFLYLVTVPLPTAFRTFLTRHAAVLQARRCRRGGSACAPSTCPFRRARRLRLSIFQQGATNAENWPD